MENKSIVSAVISMSLDGFIAGENVSNDEPLGVGGLALHDWMSDGSAETDKVLSEGVQMLGAIICGRNTYDLSIPWWQENGPTGPARQMLRVYLKKCLMLILEIFTRKKKPLLNVNQLKLQSF